MFSLRCTEGIPRKPIRKKPRRATAKTAALQMRTPASFSSLVYPFYIEIKSIPTFDLHFLFLHRNCFSSVFLLAVLHIEILLGSRQSSQSFMCVVYIFSILITDVQNRKYLIGKSYYCENY